jgi:hypothetical protein
MNMSSGQIEREPFSDRLPRRRIREPGGNRVIAREVALLAQASIRIRGVF